MGVSLQPPGSGPYASPSTDKNIGGTAEAIRRWSPQLRPSTVGVQAAPFGTDLGQFNVVTQLGAETFVYALLPLSNRRVLAGTGPNGSVYASDDNGISWTLVAANAGGAATMHELISLGKGNILGATDNACKVAASTDYGATWTTGPQLSATFAKVNCFCDLGSGTVLAGTFNTSPVGGYVFRSTDYGATWDAGTQIGAMTGIDVILNLGAGVVLVGGQGETAVEWFRSTDSGVTFTRLTTGAGLGLSAAEFGHSGVVFAPGCAVVGTYGGATAMHLYRTVDYGVTWTAVLTVNDHSGGIFWVEDCGNGLMLAGAGLANNICRIYESTDWGVTWTLFQSGFGGSATHVLRLAHLGGGEVLAGLGTVGQVWRTGVSSAMPATKNKQLIITVTNRTAVTLLAGSPVVLGTGVLPATGADAGVIGNQGAGGNLSTLGVLTADLAAGANGPCCVQGPATVLMSSATYVPGDLIEAAICTAATPSTYVAEKNNAVVAHKQLGKVLVGGTTVTSVVALINCG